MIVVMPVVMILCVVMAVVVAAAAGIVAVVMVAVRVVVMMIMVVPVIMIVVVIMIVAVIVLRRLQRRTEPLLDPRGLLAGRGAVLRRHCHDLGGERDVVRPAEVVPPQAARTVENQQRRRATHLVGGHRPGNVVVAGRIDADRKRPAVLLQENLERSGRHDRVMLEHGVEPYDGDLCRIEPLGEPLRLRQSVLEAPRTQHLESDKHDHAPPEPFEAQRFLRVRPGRRLQLGRIFRIEHDHSRFR